MGERKKHTRADKHTERKTKNGWRKTAENREVIVPRHTERDQTYREKDSKAMKL